MGLEGVELVLAVEDEFKIRIPDGDAAGVRTVGDLYRLIVRLKGLASQLRLPFGRTCGTAKLFYRLRENILQSTKFSARDIRPRTELATIFPMHRRRHLWGQITKTSSLQIPALQMPRWLDNILLLTAALSFFVVTPCLGFIEPGLMVVGIISPFAIFIASHWIGREFPLGCVTLRQLVLLISAKNPDRANDGSFIADPDVTWRLLREIVATTFGVEEWKVSPSTRFVEDLGM